MEEAPNECPSAAQASTPSGQPGDGGHTRGTTRTLCYQGPLRSPRPRVQCEGRRCSTTQLLLTRTFWFSTKDSHNRATFFSPVLLLTPLSPRALSSHIAKLHKPESLVETRRPPTHPPKPLRPFPALKLRSAMPHCTTLDCSVQTRASRRDPCSCLRGATALFPSPIFFVSSPKNSYVFTGCLRHFLWEQQPPSPFLGHHQPSPMFLLSLNTCQLPSPFRDAEKPNMPPPHCPFVLELAQKSLFSP